MDDETPRLCESTGGGDDACAALGGALLPGVTNPDDLSLDERILEAEVNGTAVVLPGGGPKSTDC